MTQKKHLMILTRTIRKATGVSLPAAKAAARCVTGKAFPPQPCEESTLGAARRELLGATSTQSYERACGCCGYSTQYVVTGPRGSYVYYK